MKPKHIIFLASNSLHCSVVESVINGNKYFYHFSDEKLYNWRFTKAVIMDLLEKVLHGQQIIRIKTENCTTPYKSLNVFGMYTELAQQLNKTFILYYGAAGHRRGLVDGMSSWGVKNSFKKANHHCRFLLVHCNRVNKCVSFKGVPIRK